MDEEREGNYEDEVLACEGFLGFFFAFSFFRAWCVISGGYFVIFGGFCLHFVRGSE